MEINEATTDNLNGILNIINEYRRYDVEFAERYYNKYFSRDEMTERDKAYVALIDRKVVGVIGYYRDYFSTDYSYWLGWFVVSKQFRRKKIGTKLLKKVESDLKRIRKRKIFVSTEDNDPVAKGFYTKNGFRTEGVIRDYYSKGEDQLIMSKVLY